jgi:hypothetical protein
VSDAAEHFLSALSGAGRDPWAEGREERLILCGFVGDPFTAPPEAWRPRPWRPGLDIPFHSTANVYTTVATFGRAPDGSFRRRLSTFAAGRAIMVDDVGTKVAADRVSAAEPSIRVETSPGNEQWWYLLDKPERDGARFDALIRALIEERMLGEDPGMSGVNRVGRVPGFRNGKPSAGGWVVRIVEESPARWSTEELVRAWGLRLFGRAERREKLRDPLAAKARASGYIEALRALRRWNMLKVAAPDPSGWWEIRCPWVDDHTASADNGAAIREPHEDNGYYGGFRCFHGHCADRGWRELTEWIAEESIEQVESNHGRSE